MSRSLRRGGAVASVAVLAALLVAIPLPASATTLDSAALTSATVAPGSSVSVSATWTSTDNPQVPRGLDFVFPAAMTGSSWSALSLTPIDPSETCAIDNATFDAACLWRADDTDVVTMFATLTVGSTTPAGTYSISVTSSPDEGGLSTTLDLTVLPAATPAILVAPASTTAGSTVTGTATFTAVNSGDQRVQVSLIGTAGNGTIGSPITATGLDNCVLNGSARAYDCNWLGATAGDTRTIVFPIVVAAAAPVASWNVAACTNTNTASSQCSSTALAIVLPSSGPDPGAGTGGTGTSGAADGSGELAATGAATPGLLEFALALLALGFATLHGGRRRIRGGRTR